MTITEESVLNALEDIRSDIRRERITQDLAQRRIDELNQKHHAIRAVYERAFGKLPFRYELNS